MLSKLRHEHRPVAKEHNGVLSDRKRRIYTFLSQNPIGTVCSSNDDGSPHGSVVYFTVDTDFHISFLTKTSTAKYHNLKRDSRVMMTVYEPGTQATAQIVGRAKEVHGAYDVNTIAGAILGKSIRKGGSGGLMPITKLEAGAYTAFTIHPEQVRMAVYSRPDPGDYEALFESVESYELE